jgi:hypothetical protein
MSQSSAPYLSPELASFGEPNAQYMTENKFLSGLKIVGWCVLLGIGQVAALLIIDTYYPIAAIATAVGFVAGLVMAIAGLISGQRKLLFFKDGLAEIKGSKTTALRWDDITWVKERIRVERDRGANKAHYIYTLNSKNGTQLILKGYENAEPIGTTIFDEVNKRLLPKFTEAYERGETIKFGEIAISKAGIDFGKGPIAWDEIEEMLYMVGKVAVRRSGQRLDVANHTAADTPNMSLLSLMLEKIMEKYRKEP